jgi:hypothetical protein
VADIKAGYARLAAAMDARRLELGLTWAEVAVRGGPSEGRIRVIRRGDEDNITDLTKAKIAKGLDWDRRYVDELLDGVIAVRDPFEEAIMAATNLTFEEKAASVQRHRQRVRQAAVDHLESLGITPPADSVTG